MRAGALVSRPGLTVFSPQNLGGRVTGAIAYKSLSAAAFDEDGFDAGGFQTTDAGTANLMLAITPTQVWAYYAGSWHDITGSPLTAGQFNFARATGLQLGSTIYVVISNGVDAPILWDSSSATVEVVDDTPPKWTDICTASDRIVGIIPPYKVTWGNALAVDDFPAANFRVLSDTLDAVVAIRNMGTLGLVVYKERTLWIGQPGGTTDASYFAFTLRGFWDGPASPAAVVDVDGAHFYMTDLGRVGYFDGSRHEWVGDGVWPQVRAELDQTSASHIHGVFEPNNREVYFYYPRVGDSGLCKGLTIIKVPNPAEGVNAPIAFRGRMSYTISAGTDIRTNQREALVFGDSAQIAYTIEGVRDDNLEFDGFWQTGLIAMPGMDPYRLDGFEVLAERGAGYGTLLCKVIKNDLLEDPDTSLSAESDPLFLSEIVPVQAKGADVRGRFMGLRFEFTTPITLRWYGARLAARRIDPSVPPGRARI